MSNDLNHASPATPVPEQPKPRANRRLLAALLLIAVAIAGLALMERWRQHPPLTAPPHEPSQALIAPPQSPAEPDQSARPSDPPPPPQVDNSETPAARAKPMTGSVPASTRIAPKPAETPATAYVVQVGVFNSPANARALQKRLVKAGIPAHTETRVQLGPFRDRREAETALAKVKKLGVNAVVVAPR
jgi:DedD protein